MEGLAREVECVTRVAGIVASVSEDLGEQLRRSRLQADRRVHGESEVEECGEWKGCRFCCSAA